MAMASSARMAGLFIVGAKKQSRASYALRLFLVISLIDRATRTS
jgi:hypothetical protein